MKSFSEISLQKHRVRLLKQEAIRQDPHSYRARGEWIKQKVLACNRDQRSLEDLRELVRRLPWAYPPTVIDLFLDKDRQAEAFDSVQIETPIERAKKRWPIRAYCEEVLGLHFDKDNCCQCPLHEGKTLTSLHIDEESNLWFCFGNCPHDSGKDYRSGDVVDCTF